MTGEATFVKLLPSGKLGILKHLPVNYYSNAVCVCVSALLLMVILLPARGQNSLCRSHLWSICSVSLAGALIAGLEADRRPWLPTLVSGLFGHVGPTPGGGNVALAASLARVFACCPELLEDLLLFF